jgi:hypothetical protein
MIETPWLSGESAPAALRDVLSAEGLFPSRTFIVQQSGYIEKAALYWLGDYSKQATDRRKHLPAITIP